MEDTTILILFFGTVFALILYKFQSKMTEISLFRANLEEKKQKQDFRLKKLRITNTDDEDEDDTEKLPDWLEAVLQGAELSPEKIKKGDTAELRKVKSLLDKHLSGAAAAAPGEDVIR